MLELLCINDVGFNFFVDEEGNVSKHYLARSFMLIHLSYGLHDLFLFLNKRLDVFFSKILEGLDCVETLKLYRFGLILPVFCSYMISQSHLFKELFFAV